MSAPLAPTSVLDRRLRLAELLDLKSFRAVCESFVELYKIGIKVFDLDGDKIVDVRAGNTEWCSYIFENSSGRHQCTQLVTRIKGHDFAPLRVGRVVEQECFSGLRYEILPVTYGGDLLGRVIYGPFMPASREGPGEAVLAYREGFDPEQLWSLRSSIRRVPDDTISRVLNNFREVIDAIVAIAYKALMSQQFHLESITQSHWELERANAELAKSLEKHQELDKLKSSFLAMISHELRTPLTSIIGFSELLIDGMAGDLAEEQGEMVGTIKEKGQELLGLIGSILDLSRIESGSVELALSEVHLEELLERAARELGPAAEKKGVALALSCAPGLPAVSADREKLAQCLANLAGNAVKFTAKGGHVHIEARRFRGARRYSGEVDHRFGAAEEDFVRIDVIDDGVGIPADKLGRVFEPFFQVEGVYTRQAGGTGLGLAIVKTFVDAHGGEVWVESAPGRGTTFSLLLPVSVDRF